MKMFFARPAIPLTSIRASNSTTAEKLMPSSPVAVFTSATGGIGEATLKQFIKQCGKGSKPRCYMIGRNEATAARIIEECCAINPSAEVIFLQRDLSLIREIDELCGELKAREKSINLLFLCHGSVVIDGSSTSEGLHVLTALGFYSRFRMTQTLLSLLTKASRKGEFSRVVSIAGGTREGQVYPDDFQAFNVSLFAMRGHLASMITMSHMALAERYPATAFVQVSPGAVETGLFNNVAGVLGYAMRGMASLGTATGLGEWISIDECAERCAFVGTSSVYPPAKILGTNSCGVPLIEETQTAIGIDGETGSGVYSVDWDGKLANQTIIDLMTRHREDGTLKRLMEHTYDEFDRITGTGDAST